MTNNVVIQGRIIKEFTYDHNVMNDKYYIAYISIHRISGTEDIIPVIASEHNIDLNIKYLGQNISVYGQFRSHNKFIADKLCLMLYVYAQKIDIIAPNIPDQNNITISGFICKKPTFRSTPLGRNISDLMLAVDRSEHKTDYLPCICFGKNAAFASSLVIGNQVLVQGRIQSREYVKVIDNKEVKRIAYEISVITIST